MEKTPSKKINLNTLSAGCDPCLNELEKIERKIDNRNVANIKIDEIKKIVSSIFDDKEFK